MTTTPPNGARAELHHLPSDPRLERAVVGERSDLAAELRRGYLAWVRECSAETAGRIEEVERDGAWRPDDARARKGMV